MTCQHIEKKVTQVYQNIEERFTKRFLEKEDDDWKLKSSPTEKKVVSAYQTIEKIVVDCYQHIEQAFVKIFFHKGEKQK